MMIQWLSKYPMIIQSLSNYPMMIHDYPEDYPLRRGSGELTELTAALTLEGVHLGCRDLVEVMGF